jgi:hypothetical protein
MATDISVLLPPQGRRTTDLGRTTPPSTIARYVHQVTFPALGEEAQGYGGTDPSLIAEWPRSSTTGRRATRDLDDSGNPSYAPWLVTAGGGRRLYGAPPPPAHRGAPTRCVVARPRADPSQGPPRSPDLGRKQVVALPRHPSLRGCGGRSIRPAGTPTNRHMNTTTVWPAQLGAELQTLVWRTPAARWHIDVSTAPVPTNGNGGRRGAWPRRRVG